jgi:hypothetical protein
LRSSYAACSGVTAACKCCRHCHCHPNTFHPAALLDYTAAILPATALNAPAGLRHLQETVLSCLLLRAPHLFAPLMLPALEDYSRHSPAVATAVVVSAQARQGRGGGGAGLARRRRASWPLAWLAERCILHLLHWRGLLLLLRDHPAAAFLIHGVHLQCPQSPKHLPIRLLCSQPPPQVLLHGPSDLRRAALGRTLRALLPWCATQNNSLRTFALLTAGALLEALGLPAGGGGGSGGGCNGNGNGGSAGGFWHEEFGAGGVALLRQVGS